MRVEAGIEGFEIPQRANEQARADDHDDGQSDLRHDKQIAESETAAVAGGFC
jgi:hypothetical protein